MSSPVPAMPRSRYPPRPVRTPSNHTPLAQNAFTREFMAYLDRGHGACPLRQSPIATAVADSFRYFDAQRYDLGDFIIMPNHVHLLVCLRGSTDIETQCTSWKRFTATKINQAL